MATIYCFSSTGNSLYVAKKIAGLIKAEVVSMTTPITECDDMLVGFVFPTYFLGLPKTVEQFLKNISFRGKSPYIFAVATFGGQSFGVSHMINNLLKLKGLSLSYFAKILSVENYIVSPFFIANDKPSIHEKVEKRIDSITRDILNNEKRVRDFYTPTNWFIQKAYPANRGRKVDQEFCVANCNGCGTCEKICPRRNIRMTDGRPEFQGNCEVCLACLHACPNEAINWKSSRGKKRYLNPNITKAELIQFNNPL